jgi:hypothetical protein
MKRSLSLGPIASRLLPLGIGAAVFATFSPTVEAVGLVSMQIVLEIARISLAVMQIWGR